MGRGSIQERKLPRRGHLSRGNPRIPPPYPELARVSPGCSELQGRLPTCYSPVRRFTRPPKRTFSLDLHGLGTPPAFVLSQDQTLQFFELKEKPQSDFPYPAKRLHHRKMQNAKCKMQNGETVEGPRAAPLDVLTGDSVSVYRPRPSGSPRGNRPNARGQRSARYSLFKDRAREEAERFSWPQGAPRGDHSSGRASYATAEGVSIVA